MEERLKQIQKLLDMAEGDLHSARNLLRSILKNDNSQTLDINNKLKELNPNPNQKIIEGIFNGECMIGKDGKAYAVPANYASKSKLIEGDTLKLTISDNGSYVYKQIAPAERKKTVGSLVLSGNNAFSVFAEGKSFKVLPASVTFYKGQPGDQATIVLPKGHDSVWAALDGIIKKDNSAKEEPNKELADKQAEPIVQERESLVETDNDNRDNDYMLTEEKVIPVPNSSEIGSGGKASPEPQIEFPGNNLGISDEDILKNITTDMKNEIHDKEVKKDDSDTRTPISDEKDESGLLDEFIKPIEEQPIYPTTDSSDSIKELEI